MPRSFFPTVLLDSRHNAGSAGTSRVKRTNFLASYNLQLPSVSYIQKFSAAVRLVFFQTMQPDRLPVNFCNDVVTAAKY